MFETQCKPHNNFIKGKSKARAEFSVSSQCYTWWKRRWDVFLRHAADEREMWGAEKLSPYFPYNKPVWLPPSKPGILGSVQAYFPTAQVRVTSHICVKDNAVKLLQTKGKPLLDEDEKGLSPLMFIAQRCVHIAVLTAHFMLPLEVHSYQPVTCLSFAALNKLKVVVYLNIINWKWLVSCKMIL